MYTTASVKDCRRAKNWAFVSVSNLPTFLARFPFVLFILLGFKVWELVAFIHGSFLGFYIGPDAFGLVAGLLLTFIHSGHVRPGAKNTFAVGVIIHGLPFENSPAGVGTFGGEFGKDYPHKFGDGVGAGGRVVVHFFGFTGFAVGC